MSKAISFSLLVAVLTLFTVISYPSFLHAQTTETQESVEEEVLSDDATAESSENLQEIKRSLAQRMHDLRPTRDQVREAVKTISVNLPENEREVFLNHVLESVDFNQLEQQSVNAMIEVFTMEELERMVAYFSTPEAKSISEKMPLYNGIVQPKIIQMLDNALLEMRTGQIKSD